jgi:hypothetical protein
MDPKLAVAWISVLGTVATGVFSLVSAWLARRQARQEGDIDVLALLVNHFLPYWEVEHLERLLRREPLPFDAERFQRFPDEVRHLRDLRLIEPHRPEFHIRDLPRQGDLRDLFRLTADGEKLMRLRERFQAKPAAGPGPVAPPAAAG